MPGLLTTNEVESCTGSLVKHYNTFCRPLTIFKEPKKGFVNVTTQTNYPGYEFTSQPITNVVYTPVSGTYSGMLIYDREQKIIDFEKTQANISKGRVKLKVREDAYQYIKAGKTENIQVDGLTFNVISDEGIQNFLGLKFYYFILEQTQ